MEKKNKLLYCLKLIITSHSGISSKRVCGVLGFIVLLFVLVYCTIKLIQAPDVTEVFVFAICILLGVDSITGIFYNKKHANI